MKHSKGLQFILGFSIVAILSLTTFSCREDDPVVPEIPSGKVKFTIQHKMDGEPLVRNDFLYVNEAGNELLITDLMYFISDITFYRNDATVTTIGEWKDIFYIDENIPSTKTIEFFDKIPAGVYDSVAFTFGISEQKNQSFMFVNAPEVNMAWPEVLGGGYHYLMINGKWKNLTGTQVPFNFHLGIGQLYHGDTIVTDSIYAFVHNHFRVCLPASNHTISMKEKDDSTIATGAFAINDQETTVLNITMNIEEWFKNPHVFDFNHWGGAIMQNQAAMQMAKENGVDVFRF